jgi:hypothetical protein
MRAFRIFVLLALFCCLVPVLSLAGATYLARWAGCELDPDVPVACTVFGRDLGETLFAVAQFGWNAIVTLPIFGALLAAWVVTELISLMGRRTVPQRRQAPATSRNRARGS